MLVQEVGGLKDYAPTRPELGGLVLTRTNPFKAIALDVLGSIYTIRIVRLHNISIKV